MLAAFELMDVKRSVLGFFFGFFFSPFLLKVLGYSVTSAYIAGMTFEAASKSPKDLAKVYLIYNLIAAWLAVVLCGIC